MNRRDQAKLRKKYNKGRYARFSGSSLRHVRGSTKTIEVLETYTTPDDPEGIDHSRVKKIDIYVGKISLTKDVVNGTKSSVNSERMDQYFNAVKSLGGPKTLREDLGIKDPRYKQVWLETPILNRINLANTKSGRLDMYWLGRVYFLVDLDLVTKTIRRSRDYGKKERALEAVQYRRITWVEQIPLVDTDK